MCNKHYNGSKRLNSLNLPAYLHQLQGYLSFNLSEKIEQDFSPQRWKKAKKNHYESLKSIFNNPGVKRWEFSAALITIHIDFYLIIIDEDLIRRP